MEYIDGLLVLIASYVSNDLSQERMEISKKSILQLQKVFHYAKIVIVDNNSQNNDWYDFIKSLNIPLLINCSETNKYEVGAYNYGLQFYRAKRYLCFQHNVIFNFDISQQLNENEPDVYVCRDIDNLSWDYNGLLLVNSYLQKINQGEYTNQRLCVWNCFYCNDHMIDLLLRNNVLGMECKEKNHSNAFERILGVFFCNQIGKHNVKILDNNIFEKIWFNQQ
jgi:hypothetical protein